jgi:hypothetical protein
MGASLGSAMANFAVACFTAGTPIVVDLDGNSLAVDELEVGDLVLARSEFDPTGPLELKRVEEKFVRTSVVMELVVRGRAIKTTVEHPFYVPAQNDFVPAGQIKAGDHLISHDGELVQVDAVHSTDEVTTVYNLRVADHHTYFVGGTIWGWDVWVHNASYAQNKHAIAEAIENGELTVVGSSRAGAGRTPLHHVFAQRLFGSKHQTKAWFSKRGVDIDRITVAISQGEHEAIHKWVGSAGWNRELRNRLTRMEAELLDGANPRQLSAREIWKQGYRLLREAGYRDATFIRYK